MIDTDLLKRLCALEVAGKGDGGIDFLDDARGLTGGIGSGKTTVSDLFSELGIDVVDATSSLGN